MQVLMVAWISAAARPAVSRALAVGSLLCAHLRASFCASSNALCAADLPLPGVALPPLEAANGDEGDGEAPSTPCTSVRKLKASVPRAVLYPCGRFNRQGWSFEHCDGSGTTMFLAMMACTCAPAPACSMSMTSRSMRGSFGTNRTRSGRWHSVLVCPGLPWLSPLNSQQTLVQCGVATVNGR